MYVFPTPPCLPHVCITPTALLSLLTYYAMPPPPTYLPALYPSNEHCSVPSPAPFILLILFSMPPFGNAMIPFTLLKNGFGGGGRWIMDGLEGIFGPVEVFAGESLVVETAGEDFKNGDRGGDFQTGRDVGTGTGAGSFMPYPRPPPLLPCLFIYLPLPPPPLCTPYYLCPITHSHLCMPYPT